jgi:hypothetical protein
MDFAISMKKDTFTEISDHNTSSLFKVIQQKRVCGKSKL